VVRSYIRYAARSGPELQVDTGGACIPNPQKANKLGEDSLFITKDGKSFGAAAVGLGGQHACAA
jgi:hypothetical protein